MNVTEAFERAVRWVMRDTTYLGTYPGTIMSQSGELCDIKPDSEKIGGQGGLSGVPLRHGGPGVTFQVAPGSRAMLAFENGDPDKPYVALWEKSAVINIVLADGSKPIARVGDQVTITSATSATGGPVTGTGIISAGNPQVLG